MRTIQAELPRMRDESQSAMMDTCRVLEYSPTTDLWNTPIAVYSSGSLGGDIACSYEALSASEIKRLTLMEIYATARVRIPLGTAVDQKDRIRVTKLKGASVSLEDYDIVGDELTKPTCLVLLLRRVEV